MFHNDMIRYLTSSIPYVNGTPHIGHALECIQVDTLLRYYRARGETIRGQFGSDDNSLKNVRAAQAAGEEVEAYVARHSEAFKALQPLLNLSFDDFMRTREDRHIRGAQKLWSMMKAEDIYQQTYEGLYCVGCEAFYTDEEAPQGVCQIHQKPLERIKEENYFFRLSKYQAQLEELIVSDRLKITPASRKNEALGFIRQGLQDFSISRSVARAENWGVPVPNDPNQIMYVWVDALSNYITALDFADGGEAYQMFWERSDVRTHVIGKDIMRFHVIYWPAFLLSAGVSLPTEVFIHGHFTIEGQKMSKSLGNVIAPEELVATYGVDAVRYALLRDLPCGEDGDVSRARLDERYAELANGLGNLVGRVAAMANKYAPEGLPEATFSTEELNRQTETAMRAYDFKAYLEAVWSVVGAANEKVDKEAPFRMVKTDPDKAKQALAELACMVRWIAVTLAPVMPTIAAEIAHRYKTNVLLVGEPLFPKAEG
jgi:methionyl-tRNA synthetase